jgi:two-component system, OmpR family, response regulator MprA
MLDKWLLGGLASFVRIRLRMKSAAKKILLVDSDDAFRGSLRQYLQGLGYEVFEAISGPEAIDKASVIRPDLIMTDVRLPGMNADEVTTRLKRMITTRNIPVILNTGWTMTCNIEERINRALNAGADEVLYRPFQFPILRNVLRAYLLA